MSVTSLIDAKKQREDEAKERIINAPDLKKTVLDTDNRYCNVDLMAHLDSNHIISRMAIELSKVTAIKESTIMLVGLSVFSSVLCRTMAIDRFGGALSSGLYCVAQQPPATAKSRVIDSFQFPFMRAITRKIKELREKLKNTSLSESEIEDVGSSLAALAKFPFFVSNTTPEGLEKSLNKTGGAFACVSSEQGMFNSLIGGMYNDGNVNNNDVVLYGYAGEHLHVERVSRQGFSGTPYGAIVLFSQDGSIETLLRSSQSSGMAERFLKIAEKPRFGEHIERRAVNTDLLAEYGTLCESILEGFLIQEKYKNTDPLFMLPRFNFPTESVKAINELSNSLDKHFADGAKYSNDGMRGFCGKADIHARKIAVNLHAMESGIYEPTVNHKHVVSAIKIINELILSHEKLLSENGAIGNKSAYQAIIKHIDGKKRTLVEITQYCQKIQPFKSHNGGSKVAYVKTTVFEMIEANLLAIEIDLPTGKELISVK